MDNYETNNIGYRNTMISSSNFYYEIIYDELFGGFSTKT